MGNSYSRNFPTSEEKSVQKPKLEEEDGRLDLPKINEEPVNKKKRFNEEINESSGIEMYDPVNHESVKESIIRLPIISNASDSSGSLLKYQSNEWTVYRSPATFIHPNASHSVLTQQSEEISDSNDKEIDDGYNLEYSNESIIRPSIFASVSDASESLLKYQSVYRPPNISVAPNASCSLVTQQADDVAMLHSLNAFDNDDASVKMLTHRSKGGTIHPSALISIDGNDYFEPVDDESDGWNGEEFDNPDEDESDKSSEDESDDSNEKESDDDQANDTKSDNSSNDNFENEDQSDEKDNENENHSDDDFQNKDMPFRDSEDDAN